MRKPQWLKAIEALRQVDVVEDIDELFNCVGYNANLNTLVTRAKNKGLLSSYHGGIIRWSDGSITKVIFKRERKAARKFERQCNLCKKHFKTDSKFKRFCQECKRTKVQDLEWAVL